MRNHGRKICTVLSASNGWEVRSPSREYLNLSPEVTGGSRRVSVHAHPGQARRHRQAARGSRCYCLPCRAALPVRLGAGKRRLRHPHQQTRGKAPPSALTLAHELAHYLLHRDLTSRKVAGRRMFCCARGSLQTWNTRPNRLASDLYHPISAACGGHVPEYSGPMTPEVIEDLARRFGVSTAAMEIKLQMV